MYIIKTQAPGSKSLSHRAIIGAALSQGISKISGVLESDDIKRTIGVLEACGASITKTSSGCFTVNGFGGPSCNNNPASDPIICEMGESGTSCRVLTPILAASLQGFFKVQGKGRLHKRPIGELVTSLLELGASISYLENDGCPPLLIDAHGLGGNTSAILNCSISSDSSSQYLSGLLLAAPLVKAPTQGICINLVGKNAVSWPYVSLTLQTLMDFGIKFTVEEFDGASWKESDWKKITKAIPGKTRFIVLKGDYKARNLAVEGDWSGASYLLASGAIGPNPVAVSGLNKNALQGDRAIIDILKAMGATIDWKDDVVTVSPQKLHGITVDMGSCPDLVPTVLSVAAFATGQTTITNVAHLKIKESDRMAAPAGELQKLGIHVAMTDDSMTLTPNKEALQNPLKDILFSAHGDHRLAMSLSLLGLPAICDDKSLPGFNVKIDDKSCVAKSFPNFWDEFSKIQNFDKK